ncbi:histone [Burkholderia cepacia]|uniref:Histone n=1 Tax=Burkholderia cepacia TaxID=292 RepID=A0A2S8HY27_BURCE|nr:H-NS histone family protein [Burkholderia cepacia]PQP07476.1 histone [Burkholderia cepacia]HDR9512082.1 H-NS histone family protein [Burkholderia cepacia]
MSTYHELLAKRAALEAEINAAKETARESALKEVRKLVGEFDISAREVYGARQPHKRGRTDPKYRHPETGATWSGRGRPPAWIDGKDRALFEIQQSAAQS